MPIHDMIHQKRKELNLTQEQIARQLGVSIPAVSKWESGTACPDVTLLPILARLLKTDVNTLLCFKQELSDMEMDSVIAQVSNLAMSEGIKDAFALAMEKIQEYPTDARLIHFLALTLQGAMILAPLEETEKKEYLQQIHLLYERAGRSENSKYADLSNYMLASDAIEENHLEDAQELLDRLPEYNSLDKRMLQAKLWLKEKRTEDAEKIYAQKIMADINSLQLALLQLIRLSTEAGKNETADALVKGGESLITAFGFWNYNFYVFGFERAVAAKNTAEIIRILEPMLDALKTPWNMKQSPLFPFLNATGSSKSASSGIDGKMLDSLLFNLKTNPNYGFLQENPAFVQLMAKYQ